MWSLRSSCKISGHIYVLYKTKQKQKQRVHGSTLFSLYEAGFPFAASPSCGSPDFYDFQGPLTEATSVGHYNCSEAPSTRIRIFLNPRLFLCGYGYRPHVSGESGRRICNFLNPLSRVDIFRNRVDAKSGYFLLLTWQDRVKGLFRESPGNCSGACFSTFRGRRQILKSKPVE